VLGVQGLDLDQQQLLHYMPRDLDRIVQVDGYNRLGIKFLDAQL
jgi:hypothetical protein